MSPGLGALVQAVQRWLPPLRVLQSHFWTLFLSQLPVEGGLGSASISPWGGDPVSLALLGSHSPPTVQSPGKRWGGTESRGVTHAGARTDPV